MRSDRHTDRHTDNEWYQNRNSDDNRVIKNINKKESKDDINIKNKISELKTRIPIVESLKEN